MKTTGWANGTAMSVRAVLAGAYRGKDISARNLLTHIVLVDEEGWETEAKTICKRVPVDSLVDMCAPTVGGPTCPECIKRAGR